MPNLKTLNCKRCNAVFVPENQKQIKTSTCNVCLKELEQEIKESEEEK